MTLVNSSTICGSHVNISTWLVFDSDAKASAALRCLRGSKFTDASSATTVSRSACSQNSRIRPNLNAR